MYAQVLRYVRDPELAEEIMKQVLGIAKDKPSVGTKLASNVREVALGVLGVEMKNEPDDSSRWFDSQGRWKSPARVWKKNLDEAARFQGFNTCLSKLASQEKLLYSLRAIDR